MNKSTLDLIGSFVDQLFLVPGRVFARFEAKREVDWDAHAREVSFYLEQGYVKNPLNFFTISEKAPEFQIGKQTVYQEGFYQEISFESLYEPRNPFVRQRYLNYAENRTGYLIRWTHGDKPRKTRRIHYGNICLFERSTEICRHDGAGLQPHSPHNAGLFLQSFSF